jgi:plastocyanin
VTISLVSSNGSLSFSPNPATVKVGQTVTFYDADLSAHAIVADGGSFSTGSIGYLSMSAPITMSAEGSFGYHVDGNPAVVGTVVVTQ